jgi:hypothetical protein
VGLAVPDWELTTAVGEAAVRIDAPAGRLARLARVFFM